MNDGTFTEVNSESVDEMVRDAQAMTDREVYRARLELFTARLRGRWSGYGLVGAGAGRDARPGCLLLGAATLWPEDWRVERWELGHGSPADLEMPVLVTRNMPPGDRPAWQRTGYCLAMLNGHEVRVPCSLVSWTLWFGLSLESTMHLICVGRGCQQTAQWGPGVLREGMPLGDVAGHFEEFLRRSR